MTYESCNTGRLEGYESVYAATYIYSLDTMARLPNEDMVDMHIAYGAANDNARGATGLYQERFPTRYLPEHRMFASLRRRLREHGHISITIYILETRKC